MKYLAGIVSWGYKCGHDKLPGIYTKISSYKSWILETINPTPPGPPSKKPKVGETIHKSAKMKRH